MRGTRGGAVAFVLALLARGAAPAPDDGPPSVQGTIRDAAGKPVPHVLVRCAGTFAGNEGTRVADVTTDAAGRYEVRGLAAGKASVFLLSESGVGDGAEIDIEWRGPVTADFTIHGELELAGRVAGTEGGPFDVELDRREDLGAGAWHEAPARRVRAGADRAFAFRGLRPGLYTLRVQSAGRVRAEEEVEVFASTGGREVALAPDRSASLVVRVSAAWPEAAAFVRVAARPERGSLRDTVHGERLDDAWVLRGLLPGPHRVEVEHAFGDQPEATTTRARWFPVEVGATPEATLRCDVAEDVRLVLVPPRERTSVEGRVTVSHGPFSSETPFGLRRGIDGKPSVWEVPDHYPGMPPGMRREPTPGRTLALRDVVRGTHRIRVEALGCETVERTVEVAGPTQIEVPLVARRGRVLTLSDVEGRADRVQHLRVEARREDAGGEWREVLWARLWPRSSHGPVPGTFRAFLDAGRWRLRATCDAHGDAPEWTVDVEEAGPPIPVEPTWAKGVSVSGTLTIHGLPLDEGWIYPHRLEGGAWRRLVAKEVFVDEGGTWRVQGLVPGRYRFAHTDRGLPVLGETVVADRDATLALAVSSALPPRPR